MHARRHLDQEHAVAEAERVAGLRREERRRMSEAAGEDRKEAPAPPREIPAARPGPGRA